MDNVLIIRFSALGDISMTLPVVESVCKAYPNTRFTLLTSKMGALVAKTVLDQPNLVIKGINVKDYNGLLGLNRLYNEVKIGGYNIVADLHDVLRTKYLRLRFLLSGARTAKIDKGRKEKKLLVKHKIFKQLKSTFVRYQEVFQKLGFQFDLNYDAKAHGALLKKNAIPDAYRVGIAPFAQHQGKQYPLEKMQEIIAILVEKRSDVQIYLYGGAHETNILNTWVDKFPNNVTSFAGKQTIADDIKTMSNLDVMLTMDSSNMHMASLVGVRCVSIWGNTHPHAGFMGYNQKYSDVVMSNIPCRPCSIYGKGKCYNKKKFECLKLITPIEIINLI